MLIIWAILVEITSNFHRIYRNSNQRGQCVLISMRICPRDGSDMVETKTVFWWNGHRGHRTCLPVISFYWNMWRDLFMSPTQANSGRELLPQWIILPEIYNSVFGVSLMTHFSCAVSQAVHILNSYEIGSRINLWYSNPKGSISLG